jgi:hypothetical protein
MSRVSVIVQGIICTCIMTEREWLPICSVKSRFLTEVSNTYGHDSLPPEI